MAPAARPAPHIRRLQPKVCWQDVGRFLIAKVTSAAGLARDRVLLSLRPDDPPRIGRSNAAWRVRPPWSVSTRWRQLSDPGVAADVDDRQLMQRHGRGRCRTTRKHVSLYDDRVTACGSRELVATIDRRFRRGDRPPFDILQVDGCGDWLRRTRCVDALDWTGRSRGHGSDNAPAVPSTSRSSHHSIPDARVLVHMRNQPPQSQWRRLQTRDDGERSYDQLNTPRVGHVEETAAGRAIDGADRRRRRSGTDAAADGRRLTKVLA